MTPMQVLLMVLVVAAIAALVALVVVLVRLAGLVKTTQEHVDPLLTQTEALLNQVQPTVEQLPGLMERATLTVDAANLEILRVDQILEDVGDISASLGTAVKKIDAVSSAPSGIASSLTRRVGEALASDKGASRRARRAKDAVAGLEKPAVGLEDEAERGKGIATLDALVDGKTAEDAVKGSSGEASAEGAEGVSEETPAGCADTDDNPSGQAGYFTYTD